MRAVAAAGVVPTAQVVVPSAPPPTAAPAGVPGLPAPLVIGLEPDDALAQMLLAIQRTGQADLALTETQIQATRKALRDQLDQYLEQLRQALEAARKAQEDHDDGGFFGSIISAVADVVGAVLGTIADFAWDAVKLPVETVVDVAKNLTDPQAMLSSLESDFGALGQNGEVAGSVKGFASGVIKFAADAASFAARLSAAAAAAGVSGGNVWDAVKDQAAGLWSSLKSNILDNPQFWEVAGAIAKAVAVAGAVASGGLLGVAVVALMVVSELDKQTGFLEKVVGKDAAPWARLGIGVAAMALGGVFGSGANLGSTLNTLQGVTSIVQGVGAVWHGIRTIQSSQDQADEMDRQADVQATLNRMQQLERLTTELIELLGEKSDDQKTDQQLGSDLVQTQAAMQTAAIMPA